MEPTLYILIRKDIPDMNPGKAAAQACHAQAEFDNEVEINEKFAHSTATWRGNLVFGRTLVVHGTELEIRHVRNLFAACAEDGFGMTTDPTYPWRDWYGTVHVSEELTSAWAFVGSDTPACIIDRLKEFPLMP